MTLANMTQEETNERNREHCRRIANALELVACGQAYKCGECGEVVDCEEYAENEELYDAMTGGGWCECPLCRGEARFERVDVYDWLGDVLDVKYMVNDDLTYYAGRVTVAIGGPNVYVDTLSRQVELYWWADRAQYGLSPQACDALDEALDELYECRCC